MAKRKGRHITDALTAMAVKKLKEPGFYADGNGLYLRISKTGAKSWVQRIVIKGRRVDIGLGGVSYVSLAEARELAKENRKIARRGGDPLEQRRRQSAIPTFEEAARKVFDLHRPTWRNKKHAGQWISTLSRYAFPIIGGIKADAITTADILAVLSPIWTEKPETARRVKQRIGAVLKWCVAQGWRADNPAETIDRALPKQERKQKHHASLPYEQVAQAIEAVRGSDAWISTKLAFEFLVLTATRSGETRGARWDEIDGDTWTIPAERMKMKLPHRVPLSARALEILDEARQISGDSGLIFPSVRGKPLSDNTLSKLLRDLGIEAVPHGFRSSFRVWASEQTGIPHQVCEFALAHVIGNKAEAAYQRSDLFEKRRKLMDLWAGYLTEHKGADVVPIGQKKQESPR